MKTIRIATRKSPLALWQARWVKDRLEESGLTAALVEVVTKGDQMLDTSISKIGSKGVFTEELEKMLEEGEADIAVHSAKDLPSELPNGFSIIAVSERAAAHDVLVATKEIDLSAELNIGTSSTRRIAQLGREFPHFNCTPVRGNLQTRIEKMKEGACDALMLARAGIDRMGLEDLIRHEFTLDQFPTSAGQGIIAIEAYESIHPTIRKLIKAATHKSTAEKELIAERTFLRTLGGGCSVPVFANAIHKEDKVFLEAGVLSLNGDTMICTSHAGIDPEKIGAEAGRSVADHGGAQLLLEIKDQLGYL